ncbi:flagellar motor switch protein FliM [Oxobacter pfennigii]|uniref:Flagellar motor switch protein FliM n=1 Tax=Oxobacter pfennigii TaxID=36849 RepID=A0A0P8W9K2_9CLOT|nr:flagellar motor switch protein FliM [Oxobacter pfennigii]KPU44657.1 flagellar motor switch protein FliM [Oxobacter pfennigii]
MSEILSQSEIDALLSAISTGELLPEQDNDANKDKQQIKKYDFKSPKKFSKEHIRTLEMVYDNYARILAGYLSAQVRTSVEMKVAIVEQITYEEFIKSVSSPTILTIYKMPPMVGSLPFETNPQFVFQIIDILFGGQGNTVFKSREFTEIEKNVIRSLNEKLIENLKLAWEGVMSVEPEVLEIETNPALNQTMAPNEPVAIITLSVKINNIQSYMNLCIPYLAIEKIMDKLIVRYKFNMDENVDKEAVRHQIEKKMQNVPLNLITVLGKTQIPVKSFLDLQVGDVIQLERTVGSCIDTFVENRMHYKVLPGTFNKRKAVQVVEIIDKDVEEYE